MATSTTRQGLEMAEHSEMAGIVKWSEMASASQSDIDMSSEPSALAVSK